MVSLRRAVERGGRRAYRLVLRLFPAEFRAEFGGEMEELAAERARRERPLPLLMALIGDALRSAPREHLALWWQEASVAARGLRHRPGFTLVAAGSLAIGTGASAAVFSFADALLLRPLPVADPSTLVSLRSQVQDSPIGASFDSISYPDFLDLRARSKSFEGLLATSTVTLGVARRPDDPPRVTYGLEVSADFLRVLGVRPALGRDFLPEEHVVAGRDAVALLSDGTWRALFAADPAVLGATVRLNGAVFTVVGVLPPSFTGVDPFVRPAVYVPLAMAASLAGDDSGATLTARDARRLAVKGRLRSGVGLGAAEAELVGIARDLERAYPATNRGQSLRVRGEIAARIESSPGDARMLTLLASLVALVLLIACANVANLLLGRGAVRAKELALRASLGASPLRLVRQSLTESALLALLGATFGCGVAAAGVRLLRGIAPPTELPIEIGVRLDARALVFGAALSLGSVVLFGLVPALRALRPELAPVLRGAAAGAGGAAGGSGAWSRALVVSQVALSLVLLVAALALVRSFTAYLGGDPGFRRERLFMTTLEPSVLHATPEQTARFYRAVTEAAKRLPGVEGVALTNSVPFGNRFEFVRLLAEGRTLSDGKEAPAVLGATVDPGYFATLGIPLVAGRGFGAADTADAPRVVVVNEELARRQWPGEDPLGKRLRLFDADQGGGPAWAQVVGVARTHRYLWIGDRPREFVYLPFAQSTRSDMTLLVASRGDAAGLAGPLRALVRSVDPDVPSIDSRTMESYFAVRAVGFSHTMIGTVSAMGVAGLGLALVGLYGVMSHLVGRRTREIGLRMAMGATRRDVVRLVLQQAAGMLLIGVVLGLAGGAGLLRVLGGLIEGVRAADPVILLLVPLALGVAALLALWSPVRRAAAVDPVRTLRVE